MGCVGGGGEREAARLPEVDRPHRRAQLGTAVSPHSPQAQHSTTASESLTHRRYSTTVSPFATALVCRTGGTMSAVSPGARPRWDARAAATRADDEGPPEPACQPGRGDASGAGLERGGDASVDGTPNAAAPPVDEPGAAAAAAAADGGASLAAAAAPTASLGLGAAGDPAGVGVLRPCLSPSNSRGGAGGPSAPARRAAGDARL